MEIKFNAVEYSQMLSTGGFSDKQSKTATQALTNYLRLNSSNDLLGKNEFLEFTAKSTALSHSLEKHLIQIQTEIKYLKLLIIPNIGGLGLLLFKSFLQM